MLPTVINGLPAHILLVHVVVVLVPLGALFTVLSAVWPEARRKLGFISPLTCLIALVFVPITTHAGNYFRSRLDPGHQNPLINRHADLAAWVLPFAAALFVLSAAVWWLGRMADEAAATSPAVAPSGGGTTVATRATTRTALPTWVTVAVAAVAIAVSVVNVVQIVRVGEAGSKSTYGSSLKH